MGNSTAENREFDERYFGDRLRVEGASTVADWDNTGHLPDFDEATMLGKTVVAIALVVSFGCHLGGTSERLPVQPPLQEMEVVTYADQQEIYLRFLPGTCELGPLVDLFGDVRAGASIPEASNTLGPPTETLETAEQLTQARWTTEGGDIVIAQTRDSVDGFWWDLQFHPSNAGLLRHVPSQATQQVDSSMRSSSIVLRCREGAGGVAAWFSFGELSHFARIPSV